MARTFEVICCGPQAIFEEIRKRSHSVSLPLVGWI